MMADRYEVWLDQVREALRSINISIEDWQGVWPFDFGAEYKAGTNSDVAAMKANRFWWREQNKSLKKDCQKTPGCWLPRGHQGECQPISRATYERGDYVKVEFSGESGLPGEWMWVRVEHSDDEKRLVFGRLDNEPLDDYGSLIKLGSQLAVSYDKIRDHKKPNEFRSEEQ
jgi:hypothetical protein